MIDGHQIWFVTFSDSRYSAWKRLKKEAVQFGCFDRVIAGDEHLFESWYKEKYKERFKDRGYGFWQWKSYLMRRELDKMNEGDILLYCDAGCSFNKKGYSRFLDYIDIVQKHKSGVLLLDQGMDVKEWTKGDVFEYFGNQEMYSSCSQVYSGMIMISKNRTSCAMLDEWYYICHNHYDLITDAPSISPNYPEFIENRYDQSVLALLAIKYKVKTLPNEEVYRVDEDWSKMEDKPIIATRQRNRKQSLLKIFKKKIRSIIKLK